MSSAAPKNQVSYPFMSKILGISFLKMSGDRIYSKYYTTAFQQSKLNVNNNNIQTFEGQRKFEQDICNKAIKLKIKDMKPSQTEIFSFYQLNIVFKKFKDVLLFIFSDQEENEILLSQILDVILESLNHITQDNIDVEQIISKFESVITIIDEIIHEGIVVNLESNTLLARSMMADTHNMNLNPSDKKAFSSVFDIAKSKIKQQLHM
ncbi:nonclathrin coat protein zeta2 subunit, putative (macronuclear) [Tetrahymena thermophila SB210]|uniref:Coatomer subunit zeta n=1 Tax=Tetrahymena thermophila (strain SB210) TaxID=312017 RepID=Q22S17_TETTS|nr:nonclathrin coat protein zeta2 subunit, putative [Tetrahymena thermophila SB210]EAR87955.2 nonclathrin coat protein zeta2 subunit, putative [Tetrahymena thermophila SB210]|eukprot:XP_001008200.2 nonclathrin coat protein zeta2 subunit, putative [Tetrahymena thermophila SB210]